MDQTKRTPRVHADHQDCGCARAFRLSQEHHDWLTSFEERGVAGVVEIIAHCSRSADGNTAADTLMWVDLTDFAAMHSWTSPADVRDLAFHIVEALRDQGRAVNATAALHKVVSVAQERLASLDCSPEIVEARAR